MNNYNDYKELNLFEVANQDTDCQVPHSNSNIKLYNDDCMNVLKQMQDSSVDLIVTDPPYLIHGAKRKNIDAESKYGLGNLYRELNAAGIADGYDIELFGKEFIRVMKNINIYIYMV